MATVDLLVSDVFYKFPGLKVALSEGGIGWIPYILERTDYSWGRHKYWTGVNPDKRSTADPTARIGRSALGSQLQPRHPFHPQNRIAHQHAAQSILALQNTGLGAGPIVTRGTLVVDRDLVRTQFIEPAQIE